MDIEIKEKIEKVFDLFESSFIYKNDELILHKKWNIYIRIDNISSPEEFDYKILSYCSFYVASNHFRKNTSQYKYISNRLRRWFRKEFTHEEFQIIYQKLGNGANKNIGLKFIKSNLDMSVLTYDIAKEFGMTIEEIIDSRKPGDVLGVSK